MVSCKDCIHKKVCAFHLRFVGLACQIRNTVLADMKFTLFTFEGLQEKDVESAFLSTLETIFGGNCDSFLKEKNEV